MVEIGRAGEPLRNEAEDTEYSDERSQVEIIPPNQLLTEFKGINVAGKCASITQRSANVHETIQLRLKYACLVYYLVYLQLQWSDTRSYLLECCTPGMKLISSTRL
jgi:hypothetical protein